MKFYTMWKNKIQKFLDIITKRLDFVKNFV